MTTAQTQGRFLGTYNVPEPEGTGGTELRDRPGLTHDRPVLAPGPRSDSPRRFLSR